jgi:hypothetical protein
MSNKLQSTVLSSALAGLMAGAMVACGGQQAAETPEKPVAEEHAEEKAPAAVAPKADEGEQAGGHAAHECKGHNECKGQGGCAVEGQNDCKGKNPCKGKGGCKVAADAGADGGEQPASIAPHACKGHNECKGQGGCGVEGQNDCKGKNPCKGKGGCKVES